MSWRPLHRQHARPDAVLLEHEELPLAAHLVSSRSFYIHHGIYVGRGRVVHYSGYASGLSRRRGPVEEVSLEHFTQGRMTRVRPSAAIYDSKEVVRRARARLGEPIPVAEQ